MAPSITPSHWIVLDASLRVGIQRTLRVPDDGGDYPLPPSLGRLPIRLAADHPEIGPAAWRDGFHVIAPIHVQDAAWIQFHARPPEPRAVTVGIGAINAITGHPWSAALDPSPQNYVVVPHQPWLDGFKVAAGVVRQFVAVTLGSGASVEHQLVGKDEGGLTFASFLPKPGAAVGERPPSSPPGGARELGVGAGGRIAQRVYPDPYGADVWQATPDVVVHVHLIEAHEFSRLTGETVPPSPIDAATYARHGLPWFEVYDEARGELPATPALEAIKPATEFSGDPAPPASPVRPANVRPIPPRSRRRR